MSAARKIAKLFNSPLVVVRNRTRRLYENLRYATDDDYKAVEYWRNRHGRFGFDNRGVGDYTMTVAENQAILDEGTALLLRLCEEAGVDLSCASVLDVGCGIGHYAGVLRDAGVRSYTGVDIVDTLFAGLRARFPSFTFEEVDVTSKELPGMHDLIIMLDVSQHISNSEKFRGAMDNLKRHLKPGGTIVISAIIGEDRRLQFYVVSRSLETFRTIFSDFTMKGPYAFDENQIFALTHNA
jgi:2-polyprenyl-3-methyl-5-hydroxy-6-metoxy-1,4-benzoquinol methylase